MKRATNHILICLDTQEIMDLEEPTCELCDARLNSVEIATNERKDVTTDDEQKATLWTPGWDQEEDRPPSMGQRFP